MNSNVYPYAINASSEAFGLDTHADHSDYRTALQPDKREMLNLSNRYRQIPFVVEKMFEVQEELSVSVLKLPFIMSKVNLIAHFFRIIF